MRRLAKRTIASMLLVVLLLSGMGIYLVRYVTGGEDWASFGVNRHAYNSDGLLARGTIIDAQGRVLAFVEDGQRVYSENYTTRRATLHVVGDAAGNIGTGLLSSFDTELMGYNLIGGLYSASGSGNIIRTTIDADLCVTAYEALAGRKGTVAVYNYKTGAIVCMVSTPGFDPYDPPEIAEDDGRYDGAYINRSVSSVFTPGSIFKIVTLSAAIDHVEDLWTRTFFCDGYFNVGHDTVSCTAVHGEINIHDALAQSCNCAFAELALEVGADEILRKAHAAGLTTSFDMSGIPVSMGQFELADAGSSDLAWAGIGQYQTLVNPLAMARYMGAIANGGSVVDPRIVSHVTTPGGFPVGLYWRGTRTRLLSQEQAATIKEMMLYNVSGFYGSDAFPGLKLGAKSGTAEVGENIAPHAWFVGFLDDPENPYAFAVFVENGGWGLAQAGSVANTVLQELVR